MLGILKRRVDRSGVSILGIRGRGVGLIFSPKTILSLLEDLGYINCFVSLVLWQTLFLGCNCIIKAYDRGRSKMLTSLGLASDLM